MRSFSVAVKKKVGAERIVVLDDERTATVAAGIDVAAVQVRSDS